MNFLLSLVLSVVLLPASGVYNAYVARNMRQDVPPSLSGPQAPVREYARPIVRKGRGEKAVLMVHGFSGSPSDFGKLPALFQAEGYDVVAPLLPAHGRGARALDQVQAREWLEYVSKTYAEMRAQYRELIVIGLSMGASLSVLAVAEYAEVPPEKVILLSPFFKVKQEWYYVLPVETYQEILEDYVPYLQSLPGQSAVCRESPHAKRFVKRQYVSTHATGQAFRVAKAARGKMREFSGLEVPTLILQSRRDRVTDYETTRELVESLDNPRIQLITLTRANHVLPRDCEAGFIEETVLNFSRSS